jgi:RNA polymerase sigma-70 factor (ECF subfamily)
VNTFAACTVLGNEPWKTSGDEDAAQAAVGVGHLRPNDADAEQARVDADAWFTRLVREQSRFVFRVAYGVLGNSHDAEDVVQETFLKLYRNGSWREMRDEKAFLARVSWRLAVSRVRQARSMKEETAEEEMSRAELVSAGADPERELMSANEDAVLRRKVNALPEKLRRVLVLSAMEELNSRAIAAVMGIPEGTVRRRLQRARMILKEQMGRPG